MRVLLVIHDFLPGARAGSELYSYYLARELANAGISVELFFTESAGQRSVERRVYNGLACTVLHKPLHPPFNLFAEEDSWTDNVFRECLERFRPDVVHVNHLLYLSLNLPAIAKSQRVPVTFTLHDYWLTCPRITRLDHLERPCIVMIPAKCTQCCRSIYSRFSLDLGHITSPLAVAKLGVKLVYTAALEMPVAYAYLRRRPAQVRVLAEAVDLFVSPSQFLRDLMITLGLPRERIVHVPNALPTSHLSATERHSRTGRLHLGYLGTIARYKGLHILLEAFRGIRDADLTVWGGQADFLVDDYRDVLDQPNVRFPGAITDDQKAAAFSSIDALIVPSIWFENAPLVILEALICGVPVIASDIGGMKELVRDGETGFHFRTGSAEDLRRILLRCIEHPSSVRRLRPSARDVMSMEDHACAIRALYDRLARSPTSSP